MLFKIISEAVTDISLDSDPTLLALQAYADGLNGNAPYIGKTTIHITQSHYFHAFSHNSEVTFNDRDKFLYYEYLVREKLQDREKLIAEAQAIYSEHPRLFRDTRQITFGIGGMNFAARGLFIPHDKAGYIAIDKINDIPLAPPFCYIPTMIHELQHGQNNILYAQELNTLRILNIRIPHYQDDPIQAIWESTRDNLDALLNEYTAELRKYTYLINKPSYAMLIEYQENYIRRLIKGTEEIAQKLPFLKEFRITRFMRHMSRSLRSALT